MERGFFRLPTPPFRLCRCVVLETAEKIISGSRFSTQLFGLRQIKTLSFRFTVNQAKCKWPDLLFSAFPLKQNRGEETFLSIWQLFFYFLQKIFPIKFLKKIYVAAFLPGAAHWSTTTLCRLERLVFFPLIHSVGMMRHRRFACACCIAEAKHNHADLTLLYFKQWFMWRVVLFFIATLVSELCLLLIRTHSLQKSYRWDELWRT